MNSNHKKLPALSLEQKRELLRQKLQEKALKQQANVPTDRDNIPQKSYRVDLFPEYQSLQQQFANLERLEVSNPYFRVNETAVNDTTIIGGQEYISYAGYNYLGFSGDPRVSEAVNEAVERYGTSASASRVATGERPIHQELEQELAALLNTEDCLAFVSGYGTNVTVISHLFGANDLIIHDALSHSSILNGCLLSSARRIPFPHNDVEAAEKILQENRHNYERVLIVIEGVYSMDGDIADLPGFIELRNKYKTLLMVDEAHSIGVLGQTGRGIGEHFGVNSADVDIWMGTLSKTFASCGGYIAGSRALIKLLKYTAPGFLYSVGISPPNAAAALAVARLLPQEAERVAQLQQNSKLFLNLARQKGLDTGLSHDSPVIPIIIGNSMRCLQVAHQLFEQGINVQPILYPAVAEDAARLRFFMTCQHTADQIHYTVDKIEECLKQ